MNRIPTLDGWRGVAILFVLVEHSGQYGPVKDRVTNLGSFGVDIFFVLSGYIITTRLIGERVLHAHIDLRGFYLRRAFRILPLVVIYLITLCMVSLFTGLADFHRQELAGSLFFFRNYQFAANPRDLYTVHFWSLSIEEHFYLAWPVLFLYLGNRRSLWIALCGALTCSAWRLYDAANPASLLGRFLPGSIPELRLLRTDTRFDGLLLGCALALLLTRPAVHSFIFRNFPKETPLIAAIFIFLNLQRTNRYPSLGSYLLITVMLASTLVVKEGLAHQWLNFRPLVWVGEISYSLYVWQQLFLLHPGKVFPLARLSTFPLNIVCVFAAASFSYYLIERPAIAFGRARLKALEVDQTLQTMVCR
jgi:peptidoglycan/LPS O-acetylase OafA/YrhL